MLHCKFLKTELFELIGYVGVFRFELKNFDPFLVLDEFSGVHLSDFLCLLTSILKKYIRVNLVLFFLRM